MSNAARARAVGINHVALEVGNIDDALAFYGEFLQFTLRGRSETMAFVDLGDQFIAFSAVAELSQDRERHFGLVVDDKELVGRRLQEMGVEIVSDRFMDFYDPWGNRIEIVGYNNIQFSKTDGVLRGMGLDDLSKNEKAKQELAEKGMGP